MYKYKFLLFVILLGRIACMLIATCVTHSIVCVCVGNVWGVHAIGGPSQVVLDGGQDQMNPFAVARGDKSAMQPFAKLLWTLVCL